MNFISTKNKMKDVTYLFFHFNNMTVCIVDVFVFKSHIEFAIKFRWILISLC
jgi:hypothetical protein